jgi:FKBP-type peptidyl-prolyl cis-trans isomerase SlyD
MLTIVAFAGMTPLWWELRALRGKIEIFTFLCTLISKSCPVKIENNRVVQIHYTLKDDQGEILDSSVGQNPLPYIHGVGALIPGLEKELAGKQAGEKFTAVIAPADGYGEYDEDQVFQVSAAEFEGDEGLELGMQVQLDTENGPAIATVTEIDGEEITLDLNHPLAGVPLHFDVEVIEVRAATQQELDHGHVHTPGAHHH